MNTVKSVSELLNHAIALAVTRASQDEADALFEILVRKAMEGIPDRTEAEERVRAALGYHAGNYSHETRDKVECLFRCEHPFFGPVSKGVPSPEETFRMGLMMGEMLKAKREGKLPS